ncbi:3-hydroxyacyl-[acyl-carrier-protein] dehydratase FabZ [Rubripirellula tenax]|uniref:3-hydroxyacyl-[acyl-carrier-protein] dehydratase FabZ n=1 Tax=Rubripirellula tenax TaxID=2528015 RepID=A0A5C6ELY3_9BACT|nr:hypothetical protein [Rubripirellula tenax]TWU48616.1 3-hydroxyacyl-[acyl-carrier-protein] dehydratase FabZ [Rubripirellula tenax]
MTYHQHQFDRVEDYLHHRSPYLLVKAIESIAPTEIVTRASVDADAFFITGHFPGAPILPGAMMQEMTTQSAGILIAAKYNPMQDYNTHDPFFNEYALGVLVKIKNARYRGFARPGDDLKITITLKEVIGDTFDFAGSIEVLGKVVLRNAFQLTNIPSKVLQGQASAATINES